jgi:hypothetical protein
MPKRVKNHKSLVGLVALTVGIAAGVTSLATSAQAAVLTLESVTFSSYGAIPTGETPITLPGTLVTGSVGGEYLAPATSATTQFSGPYLAVEPSGSGFGQPGPVTVTIPGGASNRVVEIYVGSLDTYNSFQFGSLAAILGGAIPGTSDYGSEFGAGANGLITFTFNQNPGTLTLSTSSPSLEIAGLAVSVDAVPEPSTWALMVLGFLGLGFASYRKATKRLPIPVGA